jgi:hypothetical protein
MPRIAEFLEREAGHVVVSLTWIAVGAGLWIPKSAEGRGPDPLRIGSAWEKHDRKTRQSGAEPLIPLLPFSKQSTLAF